MCVYTHTETHTHTRGGGRKGREKGDVLSALELLLSAGVAFCFVKWPAYPAVQTRLLRATLSEL